MHCCWKRTFYSVKYCVTVDCSRDNIKRIDNISCCCCIFTRIHKCIGWKLSASSLNQCLYKMSLLELCMYYIKIKLCCTHIMLVAISFHFLLLTIFYCSGFFEEFLYHNTPAPPIENNTQQRYQDVSYLDSRE